MGLNCMLDKKRKKQKKTMYKKKIHFQMFGMFFCFYVIWTAILVVVRPALLKEGGH